MQQQRMTTALAKGQQMLRRTWLEAAGVRRVQPLQERWMALSQPLGEAAGRVRLTLAEAAERACSALAEEQELFLPSAEAEA